MQDSHLSAPTPLLDATELETLLSYLNRVHRIDLTGYKRPSLMRRTSVRMQQVGIEHYPAYFDYLQRHPDEVTNLLATIYINYTYFFRDPPVWHYLANQVVPQLIANKMPNEPIRVWSAGCASGEEAYSLAMLLMAALGIEQFQRRVQIYGTDVDSDTILQARKGRYSAYKIGYMPPPLQERYFQYEDGVYHWRQNCCDPIDFQLHNLIQDPPLPHIDLLICRNLLMYFTAGTQFQTFANFYCSLNENGFLLLGQAENLVMPLARSLFTPIHLPNKLFTKVPDAHQSISLRSCFFHKRHS